MHVSVCIITFKRQAWLKRLLLAVQNQKNPGTFTHSVVVVDNDPAQSAKPVVEEVAPLSPLRIDYYCETKKNLATLRNTAIRRATGDYVAFIDDDEFPVENWLVDLLRTVQEYKVSGVLAPVVPHYENTPPRWIVRSGVFDRPRYPTGYVLDWGETRTGNTILDRAILQVDAELFDEHFALHGEDRDFFKRQMALGRKFVWCDEAVAYETQPESRLLRRYHIRRALLRGSIAYGHVPHKAPTVLKSMLALCLYLPALPFLQLAGHHRFMKYFVKSFDHVGCLLAFSGFRVEKRMKQI